MPAWSFDSVLKVEGEEKFLPQSISSNFCGLAFPFQCTGVWDYHFELYNPFHAPRSVILDSGLHSREKCLKDSCYTA